MPINVNGTTLTGGTSFTASDSSSNVLYQQDSAGLATDQRTSGGADLIPMFSVGFNSTAAWTTIASNSALPFAYTGGGGYYNVGSCYNTSNYRFTAPWTGMYLFKGHMYIYGNSTGYTWYTHPFFLVNGSYSTRRPSYSNPYRIRLYGIRSSSGHDADINELIYLTAGDYVTYGVATSGTVQAYPPYSCWNGAYLGSIS